MERHLQRNLQRHWKPEPTVSWTGLYTGPLFLSNGHPSPLDLGWSLLKPQRLSTKPGQDFMVERRVREIDHQEGIGTRKHQYKRELQDVLVSDKSDTDAVYRTQKKDGRIRWMPKVLLMLSNSAQVLNI